MNPDAKACFKCGKVKPLEAFYKHQAMGDGHLGKCILCTRKDAAEHRAQNLERERLRDRIRGFRPGPPLKMAARRAVHLALSRGDLARQPCVKCGNPRSEGHHEDYSKPLAVRWLCKKHHAEHHRRYAA